MGDLGRGPSAIPMPALEWAGNVLNKWKKNVEIASLHGATGGRGGLVRKAGLILLALSLLAATSAIQAWSAEAETADVLRASELPEEARETLALIKQGGPFPF